MSDWTQTSPVRFLSREFKTRSGRNLPNNRVAGDRVPLASARRPTTSQSARSPAHQAPDPPQPLSRLCCSGSAGHGGSRGARWLPSLFERFPSFLRMFSGASSLIFSSALSNLLREPPPRNYADFLPGLVRFSFCGLQVVVLLRRIARQFLPALRA